MGNDSLGLPLVSIIKSSPIKSGVYFIGNILFSPLFINSPFELACLS